MKKENRGVVWIIFIVLLVTLAIFIISLGTRNSGSNLSDPTETRAEIVAENLNIPWEIAFLPNGDILATERPGNLVRIGEDRQAIEIEGVEHIGEGGLLGLALHPDFQSNSLIYLYLTSQVSGTLENRVERYRLNLNENMLEDKIVILSGIPGSANHDGGRIAFGPDNYLYITTGDAQNPENAQDTNSLAGKILRVDNNGSIPSDNPFGNEVYSYGHRNPQGLAWDNEGRLWATEHGRSGIQSGLDELNLIEAGKNYGWPITQGDETREGMVSPIIHSGSSTWAPSGAVFFQDSILFTGLRGETLYQYNIEDQTLTPHLNGEFGRLRTIILHNDTLYMTTSNRDGRGDVQEGDDKIIRLEGV